MKGIYLDYAATTPIDIRVINAMNDCLGLEDAFANPSSTHKHGMDASYLVESAREKIAGKVCIEPKRLFFTSGATESNNIAIKGIAHKGKHIITSLTEHKAVLDTVNFLESHGVEVTYLKCDSHGMIDLSDIEKSIKENTVLVSIMHVNNEIGVEQDIKEIARICKKKNILFHVDAAQSPGKIPIELNDWGIDLASLTAHKSYGPKGIGALYVREGIMVNNLFHGGDQERGLRPGTLATHQIVGMGKAYELFDIDTESKKLLKIKKRLWSGLSKISGTRLNGHFEKSSPHILNVIFSGIEGNSLRLAVSEISVSAGSACNADSSESSHVLSILGLSDALANSSIRFSFGRFTKLAEIDYTIERFTNEVNRLKGIMGKAPEWCRN
tara:strand:- start:192 stop:1343 length:1152 start_codon:yes stop_codon:yes gene_type:complete